MSNMVFFLNRRKPNKEFRLGKFIWVQNLSYLFDTHLCNILEDWSVRKQERERIRVIETMANG